MKYPVIYIKGRGDHTARFAELTGGKMRVAADIKSAAQALTDLRADRPVILYEQRDTDADNGNIRFLRSRFPETAIVLIASAPLEDAQRRSYLKAGVNSAVTGDISAEDFHRTVQFITDYAFTLKSPDRRPGKEMRLFRMPLWKRTFDIVASAGAIIVLSPLLIAVAIAVRLDSPGPVIYKSKRVGSNYRVFDFLKFRSMRSDADRKLKELSDLNQYASGEEDAEAARISLDDAEMEKLLADMESGMLFSDDFAIPEEEHQLTVETEQENAFVKIENDPRITRLGRFLRKYSIDELPQLFNILRGDMSVVGNRPLPLYEAERLTSDEYIERFMCPSGLTGLWQVEKRGHAGKLSPEQRKQLDIRYAREMSPWLDLKIILRTFTAFIQKENV